MQKVNTKPIVQVEDIEMKETFIKVACSIDIEHLSEPLTEEKEEV